MKIAFLYAGQGSQKVGMGKDFYEEYPLYKKIIDSLPDIENIKQISFFGPAEKLAQTVNTQPCMVAFAIGVTALLKDKGIIPSAVGGLSLGEYSALAAADVLAASEVVSLVSFRAKAMETSAENVDSAMLAVIGANETLLQDVCAKCADVGVVEIANINCPGQIVLSGEKIAIEKAVQCLEEQGITKCIFIDVSGPFHTQFMAKAGNELAGEMQNYNFREMQIPVVFNVTGDFLRAGEAIPSLLERQVQKSVLFEKMIQTLEEFGIDTIVEIGPGKALSGFVRRINKEIHCFAIEDVKGFEKVVSELEGKHE